MRKTTKAVAVIAAILVLAVPVAIWYRARALRREIESGVPRIGIIDFYGLKKISAQQIRARLTVKEGDVAPIELDPGVMTALAKIVWRLSGQTDLDKNAVVAAVNRVPGVVRASVEFVMGGGDPRGTLFVGIEEVNEPLFEYRPVPHGTVKLPAAIFGAYDQLMNALPEALAHGAQEDDSQGYALHSDPKMRALEEKAIAFDVANLALARDVLKNAAAPDQRIVAAWLLGYASDKRAVIADLVDASRDPDETVRNNATRALGVFMEYAAQKPELNITVDPAPFIDMLNSLVWTDRNKASMVLIGLTENRPADTLRLLREKALPSLLEMAHWKDSHAWDALELLGRIGGMDEKEIDDARGRDDRQSVFASLNR